MSLSITPRRRDRNTWQHRHRDHLSNHWSQPKFVNMRAAVICIAAIVAFGCIHAAQAQACPSTVCTSTTCCNFRFRTKDAKCGTGTAAVTLADNCRDNNRPFRVLRSSGGTTCRCKNAINQNQVTGYSGRPGNDIIGLDIPCQGKTFCQVCGGPAAVATACTQRRGFRCMAFTYDTATRCGLLKYDAPTSNIITKPGTTIYVVQSGQVDNVNGYTARYSSDVPGKNLACKNQPDCKVCGAARKVAEECGSTANRGKCVGFTYDGKCGMLKTSLEGAVAKGGSTVYIMGTPSIASGVLAPAAAAPATAKA